jgi:hypothetical protein
MILRPILSASEPEGNTCTLGAGARYIRYTIALIDYIEVLNLNPVVL